MNSFILLMIGISLALLLHTFSNPYKTIKLNIIFTNAKNILRLIGKIIHFIPLTKSHGVPKIYDKVLFIIKNIKYVNNIFIPFNVWNLT